MKGIVYKIICKLDENFCYIGSTIQTLNVRWIWHKNDYKGSKNMSTHKYYDKYGIEKFEIELIEEGEFNNVQELKKREQFYIDTFNCVNIKAAYTGLTNVEYDAKYYEKNKEKKKEYYQKNKEKLKEKITCECGSIVSKSVLARHKKSQKHINYLNSLI